MQCKVGMQLLNPSDLLILGEKIKNKLGSLKADLANDKQEIINKKTKERDLNIMSKKIKKTQDLGYKVLGKELNIEALITKEEQEKEQLDIKNLLLKIQKEKSKRKCLVKNIKLKKLEREINIDKSGISKEISSIKKDIAENVEIKRAEMKRRIQLMK